MSEKPTFTGFDSLPYTIGDRVELDDFPARRGTVVSCSLTPRDRVHVIFDTQPDKFSGPEEFFRRL